MEVLAIGRGASDTKLHIVPVKFNGDEIGTATVVGKGIVMDWGTYDNQTEY
jgi:leucyl aminopeptidase